MLSNSSHLALLIPLFFFMAYALIVTFAIMDVRDDLAEAERARHMLQTDLANANRQARTYRQSLLFYAEENHWDPLHPTHKGSIIASDQGDTARLALSDYYFIQAHKAGM